MRKVAWIGAAAIILLIGHAAPVAAQDDLARPNGIYVIGEFSSDVDLGGDIDLDSDNLSDVGVAILHDGRIIGTHFFAATLTVSIYTGTFAVEGDGLSGLVRGLEFELLELLEVLSNLDPESVEARFAFENRPVSGRFVEGESLQLAFTDAEGEDTRISLQYDDVYDRASSLSLWEGNWEVIEEGVSTATLTVDSGGAFFGQDADGCTATGNLSIIDPDRNLYALELDVGACADEDGHYSGFAYLDPLGGSENEHGLFFAVTEDGRSIWGDTYSRPGAVPPTTTDPTPSEDDHGNDRNGATSIGVSSDTPAVLTANDVDYFRIDVNGSGTLRVYAGGSTDTQGVLENAGGSALDDDDDSGTGFNFAIEHPVSSGTYFVRVSGWTGATGNYTLHVRFDRDDGGDGTAQGFDLYDAAEIGTNPSRIVFANDRFYVLDSDDAKLYAFLPTGQRDAAADFELDGADIQGITFANDRFYAVDSDANKVYAYTASGQRDEAAEFDLEPPADNPTLHGIAYANGRFHIVYASGEVQAYSAAGQRDAEADFDLHSDNFFTTGIAYANRRFYVSDFIGGKVYAYTSSGQRVEAAEFDLHPFPVGIAYANDRFHVLDLLYEKVYAYTVDGQRDATTEFDLNVDTNTRPRGIAYANGHFYVSDFSDNKVYAYSTSGQRNAAVEFDLHPDNSPAAAGIAYTNGRFYVVDWHDTKVYAYSASGQREASAEFDLHPENSSPRGIAYADGRFHVVDQFYNKAFAYSTSGERDTAGDFDLHSDNSDPLGVAYADGQFWVVDGEEGRVFVAYVDPTDGDGAGDGQETTYRIGDTLSEVPTGSWATSTISDGQFIIRDGVTSIRLENEGYFGYGGFRYTCRNARGCWIGNREVVSGTIVRTATGATPQDSQPSFAGASSPGNPTYTVGTAIASLTLPEAGGGDGTLSYSLEPQVPGLSFDAATRRLTGRPTAAGSYAVTYTATDADGDAATLGFTVTVTAAVDCYVGLSVGVGESCTYPGTTDVFSVNTRGRGSFLGRLAGIRIRINNETIDGRVYDFEASHQGDGVWRIDRIAGSSEAPTTPPATGDGTAQGFDLYDAGEIGANPFRIVYANGRFYVLDEDDAKLYAYLPSGQRDATADIDLHSTDILGITFANGRFYTVDLDDNKVYAYTAAGQRHEAAEFNLEPPADSPFPLGIAYANGRFHVVYESGEVRAYADSGQRDAAEDFQLHADNSAPEGIEYANDQFWVVDRDADRVYAYTPAGQRNETAEFDLHADNSFPYGIAYANGRFHVVDWLGDRVYAYTAVGQRDATVDFDLNVDANTRPVGIAYADNRLHVVDRGEGKVYSYSAAGQQDAAARFELHAENSQPWGFVYGNGRFHVLDQLDDKVYAYLTSGERDSAADFDLHPNNSEPWGIAYANGPFYVADVDAAKVYAYSASGQRDAAAEFDLHAENYSPAGIAYANGRFYVADGDAGRVFAYSVSGQREASAEFDLHPENYSPQGIAYADGQFWVVDISEGRVFAYADPTDGDGAGDGQETTYGIGDTLSDLPTGSWVPDAISLGQVIIGDGGTSIRLDNGGYIDQGDFRYTCQNAGGCEISNREVVSGTIVRASVPAMRADSQPSFAGASVPANPTYTVGTAIDVLSLPDATGGDGTLAYSLSPAVPGLSFDATARQLAGAPTAAGTYAMTYTVTDADGDSDTLTFTIAVSDGTTETGSLGVCEVGMLVRIGQSCTYPGTTDAFSVNARGRGSFLTFLAGIRIRINNQTIDGRVYDFEASHQGDGVWRIDRVAGSTEPTTGVDVDNGEDTVTDTSPTWVFAGEVSEMERIAFREELEHVQTFFADEYDVRARGFTVLVGENYEALSPVYKDVVGSDLSGVRHPEANTDQAWVTATATGGAVMTLIYGSNADSFDSLKLIIAHEYFHVLQGQLASGLAQLESGEIAWWYTGREVPGWLVEGLAAYADYVYTPSRPGRRAFLGDRYTPFEDLASEQANGGLDYGDLAGTRCARVSGGYCYALSFAGAKFLTEQSPGSAFAEFWKLLGERSIWQQAFVDAFGTGVDDFYAAFEAWLPTQIPSYDRITIQIRWPDMEANPPIRGEFLFLGSEDHSWEVQPERFASGSLGHWSLPPSYTIRLSAGAIGTALISLWWSDDQITEYLLGWYKDGELTDRKSEATPIQFTGVSYSLEWNLSAHPNSLPRLECNRRDSQQDCDL